MDTVKDIHAKVTWLFIEGYPEIAMLLTTVEDTPKT